MTVDREAARQRGRDRAVRMGLRQPEPAPETPPEETPLLPERLTRHPGALRAMLLTGRLTGEQETAARAFLADRAAEARLSAPIYDFPGDAA